MHLMRDGQDAGALDGRSFNVVKEYDLELIPFGTACSIDTYVST